MLAIAAGLVARGVVITLRSSRAVPVVMAEPLGPVASRRRSRALTRGHLGASAVCCLAVAALGPVVLAVSRAAPMLGARSR